MSVTIIGVGWLGLPLGKELVNRGHLVHGSVRREEQFSVLLEAGITPFMVDLENTTHLPSGVTSATETLIICIPPMHRNHPQQFRIVLTRLLKQFSDATRVIFTSSTGIYPQVAGDFVESFQFSIEQDSTVLNIAENTIRESKKPYVIFRLGGLIGPNRHPIRYLEGRTHVNNPNGPINFVHQGDCVRAISQAVENTGMHGTYNLVYPSYPTRQKYYTEAAKHYGLTPPTFNEEGSIQRVISSEKIIQECSFEFKYPIDRYPQLNLS